MVEAKGKEVNPWGVEPQSKEPESFILSIELRVPLGEETPEQRQDLL